MTLNKFEKWFDEIWERKVPFFAVFFGIVLFSYAFLSAVDFIPEAHGLNTTTETSDDDFLTDSTPEELEGDSTNVSEPYESKEYKFVPRSANPTKIIFDTLDKEVNVVNPTTRTISGLDTALLSGAVRHPDSADFLTKGTMFLFGHSSYLPNVLNKNFQAFNGIQDLTWGDKIRVQSGDAEYIYRVDRVYKVKASTAEVAITSKDNRLTLVTCNSFGSKDDRNIVESTLVKIIPLEA